MLTAHPTRRPLGLAPAVTGWMADTVNGYRLPSRLTEGPIILIVVHELQGRRAGIAQHVHHIKVHLVAEISGNCPRLSLLVLVLYYSTVQ